MCEPPISVHLPDSIPTQTAKMEEEEARGKLLVASVLVWD